MLSPNFANSEENTATRREAVSTIGRMRTPKAIPTLIQFLKDEDPKVILQAIRGLINFRRCLVRDFSGTIPPT